MILYHGSNIEIGKIDLQRSRPNKDFGRGFYLSDDYAQAMRMAELKSEFLGGIPVVTSFEFNEQVLCGDTLKILKFDSYSEEWADFVFRNRNTRGGFNHPYDIVYGPIANDRIGIQIQKLNDGAIDLKEFLNRLKYMKGITFQYFFGSEEAIGQLRKI